MKKILIIEDDNPINELLYDLFRKNYDVTQAYAGSEGRRILKEEVFDLIVLDLMLPGISGEELIKKVREFSAIPILVITAKAEVDVLAHVLKLGANDYISKPFNTIEVTARVEALLRDVSIERSHDVVEVGELRLDQETRLVTISGQTVKLTQKEFDLLQCFMTHPNKVFTKANLYETVWGDPYYGDDNTISVHVSRLRTKLNYYGDKEWIKTVWGVGFKLNHGKS